jgi:hypothetical protein
MALVEVARRVRTPVTNPIAWLRLRLAAAAFSAGMADWLLLYHTPGISWTLFLILICVVATGFNPVRADKCNREIAAIVFVAGILPIIEEVGWFSFFIALLGLAACRTILISPSLNQWGSRLRDLYLALLFPFVWPIKDCVRVLKLAKRRRKPGSLRWQVWILPSGCTLVFFLLFADANPLLAHMLEWLDIGSAGDTISLDRVFFWFLVASLVWPFLHLRSPRRLFGIPVIVPTAAAANPWPVLFSVPAILYSLISFNVLFGFENLLDLGYLWFGVALPEGMTFAEYAHRGAYPLMITAMLAVGFVLTAMRPNGAGERSRPIRLLVIVWTIQNLVLVISAIRRLDFYVASYSLTYWRVAAFVWMALVAFGVITILIRILCRKTTSWLVTINAGALAATLYLSCFAPVPALIAGYNLDHSREATGQGATLDWSYLAGLGPSIIPVLDAKIPDVQDTKLRQFLLNQRRWLAGQVQSRDPNWRAWTVSSWRLRRYLANTPPDTQDPDTRDPLAGRS